MQEYRYLKDVYPYCKKWGVELIEFTHSTLQLDSKFHYRGPGTTDIIADKQVILFRHGYDPNEIIGDILHDLSHLICGESILSVDEVMSSMLALDLAHHRYLDNFIAYELMMKSFLVYEFGKGFWRDLSFEEKETLYNRSHFFAEEQGLLKGWEPTFYRSKVNDFYGLTVS